MPKPKTIPTEMQSTSLGQFFDDMTMSVHLKEGMVPVAKKGEPGNWKFVELEKAPITQDAVKGIADGIMHETDERDDGFIEIEREGSTIVQLGAYRIVITRPPFSDGWEITAVRPVKRLNLEDYELSEKLKERVGKFAEGILIAGSPGMGKTTFAQALAQDYSEKEKIVKTVEAPRDLQLGPHITQYSIRSGSREEIHDVLLLSRPDYTIYDEMRNTEDFMLFSDMRLAGVGMVGVIHATAPVDAIQRFVGRVELGVIPHIIDTVVFIKDGRINKVLSLQMVVKVPSGMTEADLARPIVVVTDFETKKLEYELYSYGEETVVVPVSANQKSPVQEMAAEKIEEEFKRYSESVKVDVNSDNSCDVYLPPHVISRVIGKGGTNIESIEKRLGIHVNVKDLDGSDTNVESKKELEFNTKITKKGINFFVDNTLADQNIDIYIDDDYVLTAKVSKKGVVKIHANNKTAKIIIDAINLGEKVKLLS